MKPFKALSIASLLLLSTAALANNCPAPETVKFNPVVGQMGFWTGVAADGTYFSSVDELSIAQPEVTAGEISIAYDWSFTETIDTFEPLVTCLYNAYKSNSQDYVTFIQLQNRGW